MGTTVTGHLSPSETKNLADTRTAMGKLGSGEPITPPKFVFLAAFDGTNNDKNNVPLSGSPYQTNVANIYD
jgi:hypothetical protein